MIPKRLVRTIPQTPTAEQEALWADATAHHPEWDHVTWQDPIDRSHFPLTSRYWDECETGAQLADLVRAEDLLWHGGVYVDSDVQVLKPFDSLLDLEAFAGWEDTEVICNAVMGFPPFHQAIDKYLTKAIERRGQGTWKAGVGTFTGVMRNRTDVTLLPPETFYPVHWRKAHAGQIDWDQVAADNPQSFTIHRYSGSWLK